MTDEQERMLKWFAFAHLPERLQDVSKSFFDLATMIVEGLEPGPDRGPAKAARSEGRSSKGEGLSGGMTSGLPSSAVFLLADSGPGSFSRPQPPLP